MPSLRLEPADDVPVHIETVSSLNDDDELPVHTADYTNEEDWSRSTL